MYAQASTGLAPTSNASQNAKLEVIRRSANYQPSIWGDRFISYSSDNMVIDAHSKQKTEELKEEARRMLMVASNKPSQRINLIDSIQRLGLSYHFEREIEEALQQMYDTHPDHENDDDLYSVALRFRLLRQQGYNVSSDVFNKFKDNKGDFKPNLIQDVRSMLSLYEATHLRVHGEDILDEALAFTTTHLKSMVTQLSTSLATQVMHVLKQPLHKGIPRLEARHYISVYQEEESRNETLLKLAKLDFNQLQSLYQKELSDISKWWKGLDFTSKLPFARDRVVECYFWILGVYFEPQYFLGRRILTKVTYLTSILDDIYDVYGTLEELKLFKEAIESWDVSAMDQLPEYMKVCYQALLDVYDEIEEEMIKKERSYRVYYAKEAMKNQVRAYFDEAKWFHEGYIPTMEEYMSTALVSSAYSMLTTTSFVGMGDIVTKEAFDWVISEPKIITASLVICRLMDDLVGHKFEQERGHVASSVECYMKQHGVSEQEVHDEFHKRVRNAWKDINHGCLRPTDIPMPLLMRVLNLVRVIDVLYKDKDGYSNAGTMMKDYISELLIDPVTI
ncbi:hypothetical protein HHK36_002059 [Tetracentron sinense]|uniref:Uncharacterized protein n=1 Tax=Tetracentron sinense TaxID=13715 RepID=A0A834ZYD5_TETSI|nr:hypothetical protein HHK36_002059 [Tetracentron sinense]